MLDYEKLKEEGKNCGFTHVAPLSAATLEPRMEVRGMCEQNTCHMYGSNWCCPPGVGTLEECTARIRRYREGILVQTVGQLEDSMDVETMMETEEAHKTYVDRMRQLLEEEYGRILTLGSGTCTRCKKCAYPDKPCRFPENSFGSMEAYGIVVSDACKANDLPYYYGPCTIAYTAAFLLV